MPSPNPKPRKMLPLWASHNQTCETCIYEINGVCRHHITSYGYAPVVNHGKYRPACSLHETATIIKTEPRENNSLN